MDGGAWWAAVHGVTKSRTRLSNFTFTFHLYELEKEMATHSSVLAWRIPGTGKPGGLPSMGSHRVGHDWSALAAAAATLIHWVSVVPFVLSTNPEDWGMIGTMEMLHNWPNFTNFLNNLSSKMGPSVTMPFRSYLNTAIVLKVNYIYLKNKQKTHRKKRVQICGYQR